MYVDKDEEKRRALSLAYCYYSDMLVKHMKRKMQDRLPELGSREANNVGEVARAVFLSKLLRSALGFLMTAYLDLEMKNEEEDYGDLEMEEAKYMKWIEKREEAKKKWEKERKEWEEEKRNWREEKRKREEDRRKREEEGRKEMIRKEKDEDGEERKRVGALPSRKDVATSPIREKNGTAGREMGREKVNIPEVREETKKRRRRGRKAERERDENLPSRVTAKPSAAPATARTYAWAAGREPAPREGGLKSALTKGELRLPRGAVISQGRGEEEWGRIMKLLKEGIPMERLKSLGISRVDVRRPMTGRGRLIEVKGRDPSGSADKFADEIRRILHEKKEEVTVTRPYRRVRLKILGLQEGAEDKAELETALRKMSGTDGSAINVGPAMSTGRRGSRYA